MCERCNDLGVVFGEPNATGRSNPIKCSCCKEAKMWTPCVKEPRGKIRALITNGSVVCVAYWEPDVKTWMHESGNCVKFKPTKYMEINDDFLASPDSDVPDEYFESLTKGE